MIYNTFNLNIHKEVNMTETIVITPRVAQSFPFQERQGLKPVGLVLEDENIVVKPVPQKNSQDNVQWYVLTSNKLDEYALGDSSEYDKYKVISSPEELNEYKHRLVSVFREVIEEKPYSSIFVTIDSSNRELNIDVKKFDSEKNQVSTLGEFIVKIGREGFNDFNEAREKPKSLTMIETKFNGNTENKSGYLNHIEGFRIDNEFVVFLEMLKNKLYIKEEKPFQKLKLSSEQLQQVFKNI